MNDETPKGWARSTRTRTKMVPPWDGYHPVHASILDGRAPTAVEFNAVLAELRRLNEIVARARNLLRAQDSFDKAVGELRDAIMEKGS